MHIKCHAIGKLQADVTWQEKRSLHSECDRQKICPVTFQVITPSKLFLKGPPLSKQFFMGSRLICEICPTDLGNVLSGMSDYISMAFFQVHLVMLNHQWAETKFASGPVEQQKDHLLGKLTMNAASA